MIHTTRSAAPEPQVVIYGDHPEQRFTVTAPDNPRPDGPGTVVLLHGGYWRASFTSSLMEPMSADLAAHGWHVANIEYRRVGAGGGWPAPLDDAVRACETISSWIQDGRLPGPAVLLGHSVGGQLALMAAQSLSHLSVAGVLAVAPVTDVLETLRAGLGEDAAVALLADVEDSPEEVAVKASPRYALPIGVPVVVVHGVDDARVPHAQTVAFVSAAREAGDEVRLLSFDELEHRSAIDPSTEKWPVIREALRTLSRT